MNENNSLVSIIMPVHNSEKYLMQIMNCIFGQKYTNWELIIVDDHSKDKTMSKIKKTIAVHPEFSISLYENTKNGVSAARNIGMKHAKGKYIVFIDDDDKLGSCYISDLVRKIRRYKVQIVIENYIEILGDREKVKSLPWNVLYNSSQKIREMVIPRLIFPLKNEGEVWMPVWRSIFESSFLKNSGVIFDDTVSQAEDFLFMLQLFFKSNKVYFSNENPQYYYCRRSNSALNSYIENNLNSQKNFHSKLLKLINKYANYSNLKTRYCSNKSAMYSIAISNAVRSQNSNMQIIKEIQEIRKAYISDDVLNISIFKLYNPLSVKLGLILLKANMIYLLFIIYFAKEKYRLSKF